MITMLNYYCLLYPGPSPGAIFIPNFIKYFLFILRAFTHKSHAVFYRRNALFSPNSQHKSLTHPIS